MKVGQTDHRAIIDKLYHPKKISWTVDLQEFKKVLMVDTVKTYDNYAAFKRKVLDISQKEINELTDINIYFEPIRKGRKTIKLKICIISKQPEAKRISEIKNNELLK